MLIGGDNDSIKVELTMLIVGIVLIISGMFGAYFFKDSILKFLASF